MFTTCKSASARKSFLWTVSLTGRTYRHSFTGALALSPDGKLLYALDLAHFELVGIETRSGTIRWRVGVGRLPFAVAVSPRGDHIYVSNVGTFRYSVVPGFDVKQAGETGLDFPPFATGTPEAEQGDDHRGKNNTRLGRSQRARVKFGFCS